MGKSSLLQRGKPRQELPSTTHQPQIRNKIKILINPSFGGTGLSSTKAFEHPPAPAGTRGASPPGSCHLSAAQEPFAQPREDRKPPRKRILGNKNGVRGVPPCPSLHPENSCGFAQGRRGAEAESGCSQHPPATATHQATIKNPKAAQAFT